MQPCLAAGLLLLLLIGAHHLHEPVGRTEIISIVAIIAGVVVLTVASPARSEHDAGSGTLTVILSGPGPAGAPPLRCSAAFRRTTGLPVAISAGLAFAWSGISTKLLSDALSTGDWTGIVGWAAATGLAAALGTASEMTALQSRGATEVAPLVFVIQLLMPVLLAPVLVGESLGLDAARRGRAAGRPAGRRGRLVPAGQLADRSGLHGRRAGEVLHGHRRQPVARELGEQLVEGHHRPGRARVQRDHHDLTAPDGPVDPRRGERHSHRAVDRLRADRTAVQVLAEVEALRRREEVEVLGQAERGCGRCLRIPRVLSQCMAFPRVSSGTTSSPAASERRELGAGRRRS